MLSNFCVNPILLFVMIIGFMLNSQVNVFVAWSLLLSHIVSLPSSSPERERMIQYVQNSTNPAILDCLFQHIPLDSYMGTSSKRKDIELPAEVSEAANAARRAVTSSSVLFSLELLWPIEPAKMASLAGAIFGLMLHNLPAYVRGWFSDIRDRSALSAIESFTKAWCSPTLISNELSQVCVAWSRFSFFFSHDWWLLYRPRKNKFFSFLLSFTPAVLFLCVELAYLFDWRVLFFFSRLRKLVLRMRISPLS